MKNSFYFFLLAGVLATAQVRMTNSGVAITSVNSSAFIDASSQNTNNATLGVGKGLVFPRVDLSTFTFVGTAGIPNNFPTRFDGMIVYNTSIGGVAGAGATEGTLSEGYWYYYNKSNSITGGTWKKLQNDNNLGSNSVVLNGASFERAALTGDVTAAANSNLTTIAPDAVTSSKILDGTISTSDIANNAVTIAKLPTGATATTFLRGDGTWVTPEGTTYTAGSGITLTGTSFSVSDATTTSKGIVQLAGDLSGTSASPAIANNAVTSAKIADGTIVAADLNSMSASSGQVLKWNGTAWAPSADIDTNTSYTASTSVTLNGSSFERAALTGDITAAANSNITTIAPDAVTSSKILDGTIATSDIADNAVTIAKLPSGATSTTFLRGDGTWVTPIDTNTNIYTNDGAINSNRTVSLAANALNFTSTATSGTSHFTVDGTTLNVDAVNNRLGINTATPVSSFDINGSMGVPLTTSSSDITLNESHAIVRVNTSSNDVAITLPNASTATNRIYSIIKIDASSNKILFNSTISASGYSFTQVNVPGEYKIQSDGNSWNLIR